MFLVCDHAVKVYHLSLLLLLGLLEEGQLPTTPQKHNLEGNEYLSCKSFIKRHSVQWGRGEKQFTKADLFGQNCWLHHSYLSRTTKNTTSKQLKCNFKKKKEVKIFLKLVRQMYSLIPWV